MDFYDTLDKCPCQLWACSLIPTNIFKCEVHIIHNFYMTRNMNKMVATHHYSAPKNIASLTSECFFLYTGIHENEGNCLAGLVVWQA